MRIDKDKLEKIANLCDRELWQQIVAVASSHGIQVPKNPPPSCELDKIRTAMRSANRHSLMDAMRIIDKHRKEQGK